MQYLDYLRMKESDYLKLLNIFIKVVESAKGTKSKNDERLLDAEGLSLKFFGHLVSVLYLYRGINIPDMLIPINKYPDTPSLNVIARAAFETFLVFHHVFIAPSTYDEKDFRYYSWLIAGLITRQNFIVYSPQGKRIQEEEKKYLEAIKEKIKINPIFLRLNRKQQKDILCYGKW